MEQHVQPRVPNRVPTPVLARGRLTTLGRESNVSPERPRPRPHLSHGSPSASLARSSSTSERRSRTRPSSSQTCRCHAFRDVAIWSCSDWMIADASLCVTIWGGAPLPSDERRGKSGLSGENPLVDVDVSSSGSVSIPKSLSTRCWAK